MDARLIPILQKLRQRWHDLEEERFAPSRKWVDKWFAAGQPEGGTCPDIPPMPQTGWKIFSKHLVLANPQAKIDEIISMVTKSNMLDAAHAEIQRHTKEQSRPAPIYPTADDASDEERETLAAMQSLPPDFVDNLLREIHEKLPEEAGVLELPKPQDLPVGGGKYELTPTQEIIIQVLRENNDQPLRGADLLSKAGYNNNSGVKRQELSNMVKLGLLIIDKRGYSLPAQEPQGFRPA